MPDEIDTHAWKTMQVYQPENRKWMSKSFEIALIILDEIDKKKLTKNDLAKLTNLEPKTITNILKGHENLDLKTISILEVALGIKLIKILGEDE